MSWEILEGDALRLLRGMPAESVQCVVTSPPYFGLRDYGTGEWSGGDPACDHAARPRSNTGDGLAAWSAEHAAGGGHKQVAAAGRQFAGACGKCGARREDEQIGLEATPDEYVARLVGVFREVRRVLRRDGTLWLNLGDSYAASRSGPVGDFCGLGSRTHREKVAAARNGNRSNSRESWPESGIKPKDLIGIPWMLAFALRSDGWYLRSDIIWSKSNPMPESVTDRPTSAHEHLFLLAKSKTYYYDAAAIREESPAVERARSDFRAPGPQDVERLAMGAAGNRNGTPHGAGRNKRNVWEIATVPYPDAHFATFPSALVEPCVLAGSSPRACGVCGAPWRRVTERVPSGYDGSRYDASCAHEDGSARCVVLDPFAGSGTVGVVCGWHGRDFVGLELNAEYAEMARQRIATEGALRRRAYRPAPEPDGQLGLLDGER